MKIYLLNWLAKYTSGWPQLRKLYACMRMLSHLYTHKNLQIVFLFLRDFVNHQQES